MFPEIRKKTTESIYDEDISMCPLCKGCGLVDMDELKGEKAREEEERFRTCHGCLGRGLVRKEEFLPFPPYVSDWGIFQGASGVYTHTTSKFPYRWIQNSTTSPYNYSITT